MPRSSNRSLRLLVGALLPALLLVGCTPAADDPGASSPAATQSSAAPTASPGADTPGSTVGALPTDCATVVDAATYAAAFGATPLNDPALQYPDGLGAVTPTAPPTGATTDESVKSGVELRCIWRDPGADVTFLSIEVGRASPGVAEARLAQLAADQYSCSDVLEGLQCQLVGTSAQYPVEEADTQFIRDDVLVRIQQANAPTSGVMNAVVARIWG